MAKKPQKYIVTQAGLTTKVGGPTHEIGDEVSLTDDQAAARVNKVALKGDMVVAPKGDATKKLMEQLESVTAERDDTIEALAISQEELKDVSKQLENVTKERDELLSK